VKSCGKKEQEGVKSLGVRPCWGARKAAPRPRKYGKKQSIDLGAGRAYCGVKFSVKVVA